jgi:hypothetical protein
VGPRAGLDAGVRRKILCPCRGSNPDRQARSQILYCLSYRGSIYCIVLYCIVLYCIASNVLKLSIKTMALMFGRLRGYHIILFVGLLASSQYTSGRSCDQPTRHRFSWVSFVFKQMLRWFPSFNLLLQPSRFKFIKIYLLVVVITKLLNFPNYNFKIH